MTRNEQYNNLEELVRYKNYHYKLCSTGPVAPVWDSSFHQFGKHRHYSMVQIQVLLLFAKIQKFGTVLYLLLFLVQILIFSIFIKIVNLVFMADYTTSPWQQKIRKIRKMPIWYKNAATISVDHPSFLKARTWYLRVTSNRRTGGDVSLETHYLDASIAHSRHIEEDTKNILFVL